MPNPREQFVFDFVEPSDSDGIEPAPSEEDTDEETEEKVAGETEEVAAAYMAPDLFAGVENRSLASESGFEKWQRENRKRMQAFATRLGLPVGKRVEVTLVGGTVLRGRLQLSVPKAASLPALKTERELRNHLPLRIHRATFPPSDIEACVRTDT